MNSSARLLGKVWVLIILPVLIGVFLLSQFSPKAESATEKTSTDSINYDIRTDRSETAKQTTAKFVEEAGRSDLLIENARQKTTQAIDDLRLKIPNLKIEYNETLRIPEVISPEIKANPDFLTSASNVKRAALLRNFLKQNNDLIGLAEAQIDVLKTTADYTNPAGNLSYVHFEQIINGVPVFQGEIKAGFTRKNEIVRIINNLAPSLDYATLSVDFGSSEKAVAEALKYIETVPIKEQTTAEKFYFPVDYGVARTAWRILFWTNNEAYYVIVDAKTGTLLWRKNITNYQTRNATYGIYGSFFNSLRLADSPTNFSPGCSSPVNCLEPPIIQRGTITLVGNESPYTFNDLGWIPDTGLPVRVPPDPNVTDGNAVEAGIDRDGTNGVDAPVSGNPDRVFNFSYNPAPGNPAPGENPLSVEFQKGSVTQAFYAVNRWHDEMYLLGFTEQARNFQHFNFGRGGGEGDRVSAEIQDSSGTNNANMSTPADGGRPRLQMYIWTATTPNRDGALDSHLLLHELTHGVSSRLHGNSTGLGGTMAAGMGEGWSDFYALALLSEPGENQFTTYPVAGYILLDYYYGMRRFPTATIGIRGGNGFPHNPLTLANLNQGNCATFNSAFPPRFTNAANCGISAFIGEVWSAALWEIRSRFIQRLGNSAGNRKTLQLVTDGMKLAPLNPTILQERDALVAAAQASNLAPEALIDAADVWRGFARRGIGFSTQITSTSPLNFIEAFDLPPQFRRPKRTDFDGDGRSDISVFRPSEGNWYLNRSTAGFGVVKWGISTDTLVPADYDGDGRTDFAVFRAETDGNLPDFYILKSSDSTFIFQSWGLPADIPVIEDYDGDNRADFAVFRPSNRTFYILQSTNGSFQMYSGFPDALPVRGDFDGDGRGDFGVFLSGEWFLAKSSLNYQITVSGWGLPNDKIVVADYNGDQIDDLATYRPSNGTWYIRYSSGGNVAVNFGISTDVPAPADYDGDGRADIAVFRNGTWWINLSTTGVFVTQFGLSNDLPIANRYLP